MTQKITDWYERNKTYVRLHDLAVNRIKVINQIHGCKHDMAYGNPCVIRKRLGWYHVYYCGELLVQWDGWDVEGVRLAYERLDGLANALWLVRRAGILGVYCA